MARMDSKTLKMERSFAVADSSCSMVRNCR